MDASFPDLELSALKMQEMGEASLNAVIDHITHLPEAPRSNLDHADEIARSLREGPPEQGTDFKALLDFFMQKVVPVSINTPHPAYMGYIPGGGLYPSAIADFIAAATNRFAGAWFAAPAVCRLEANVLEWFARWMGYPESARGILTSGGSLANFSAIVAARKALLGDDLARGTLYLSNQTHHSVMKAAMLAGIPERNLRILEADDHFRAVPERFEQAIRRDQQAGLKPFLLVGNAGTTNTGTVDPIADLSALAQQYGLWFHVDAAYGGFFNLCEAGHKKLADIHRSDSMVLDPHKGLFVPYGTGSLLVREGEKLRQAHALEAEYLQDHAVPEGEVNFADYSPELSRMYRGLRVWLPLKLYGVQAFRENLSEKLQLTRWMYQRFLEQPEFECFTEPDLSVIAFRVRPKRGEVDAFNRKLLSAIVESKKLFLSSTRLNGAFAIRVCILSFRTHQREVEEAFEVIHSMARKLLDE
ncbi:MAG: aminotransferase class V-fold PLP-dependent enzyme [Calditrichaeota bacterium]|nr:MAG: aminotransferase class V-fold PLP-dependent enzyme [Calditrichota bacterium]